MRPGYPTVASNRGYPAAGEGRRIETNCPVGKDVPGKPPTRSDIDFRVDTTHPQIELIMSALRTVGGGAGNASLEHGTGHGMDHRPSFPPYIRITPGDRQ